MAKDDKISGVADAGPDDVDELTQALLPTVEKAIRISVRRDSRPLVDAIFPVMGPAIRKSIAEALRSMVQSLSRSLEHSFSVRGLRWRIEALRTGRPFAEVVILNTLIYRVEQVFLIHRETGLLLQHVQSGVIEPQETDMVSAMLTAIRDFVRDSFSPDGGSSLETIRMGDVNVWVEDGPQAILAVVVRGTAPESLRSVFTAAQEAVHSQFQHELASFSGDMAGFELCRPILDGCLSQQERAAKRRTNPLIIIVPVLLLAGLGLLIWRGASRDRNWRELVDEMGQRPGVVVIDNERDGVGGFVRGARDPVAGDFDKLIRSHGFDPGNIRQEWIPVEVVHPPYVFSRVIRALSPPDGVAVNLSDDLVLTMSGPAGHWWIDGASVVVRAFPELTRVDASGLVDIDRVEAARLADLIRRTVHRFEVAKAELTPEEGAAVLEAAARIRSLVEVARRAHMQVIVEIAGRADPTGADGRNRVLSSERAAGVAALLVGQGVPRQILAWDGLGTDPLGGGQTTHNRCVSYNITLESICHD